MNSKSSFIIAVIIFIYCFNIQLNIPGTSISLPAYDLFVGFVVLFYFYGTNLYIKINSCVRPYITKLSIGLLILFFLTIASILAGVFIYSDEISLSDLNSALIYPRLIFYIFVGAVLACSVENYKKHFSYRISNLIIILSVCYIGCISFLQYMAHQAIRIPLLSQLALSYMDTERYAWIRVVGTAGNPNWNSLDLNIIISVIFSMLIISIYKRNIHRLIIMMILNTILFLLILVVFSRTGIISCFLLFSLFMVFVAKKLIRSSIKAKIFSVFAITLILIAVTTVGINAYKNHINMFQRRIHATLRVDELGQRAFLWSDRLETGMERFPLGIGPSKSKLESTVDSEFILVLGDAGVFGLIIYGMVMLFLIFKPLFLSHKKLPIEMYAMLYFIVALGVIAMCYSLTVDFARNLRASSLIFMLHSFFCCRVILFLKNREISPKNIGVSQRYSIKKENVLNRG